MENRVRACPHDYYVLTTESDQASLPRSGRYFVVAQNGVFIHKGNNDPLSDVGGFVESLTRFKQPHAVQQWDLGMKLPGLSPCETYVNLKLTPIPHGVAALAQRFFAWVYKEMHAESELQIYYSVPLDRYELVCPAQVVSGGSAKYRAESSWSRVTEEGKKFLRAGSVHSHCGFRAFHSFTDTSDEKFEDGIHITFGHNDQPARGQPFSVVTSVVGNDDRHPLDPTTCIEGIRHAYDRADASRFGPGDSHQFYYMEPLPPEQERDIMQTVLLWGEMVRREREESSWNPFAGRRRRPRAGHTTDIHGGRYGRDVD